MVLKSRWQSSQYVFLSALLLLLLLISDCGVFVDPGVTEVFGSDGELEVLGEVSDGH